jgi:hypothetical protein
MELCNRIADKEPAETGEAATEQIAHAPRVWRMMA